MAALDALAASAPEPVTPQLAALRRVSAASPQERAAWRRLVETVEGERHEC